MAVDIEKYLRVLKSRGITKGDVAAALSITPSYLSKIISNEKPLTDTILKNLTAEFGSYEEVVDKTPPEPYYRKRLELKNTENPRTVKLYNSSVAATPKAGNGMAVTNKTDYVNIYDVLGKCDFALPVSGNSMMPNYPPSSVVGMVKKTDCKIRPGEVYVVETADEAVLKRLYYKEDDSNSEILVLISDNTMVIDSGARKGMLAYPPYELHIKDIIGLYSVTGSAKIMLYGKRMIEL